MDPTVAASTAIEKSQAQRLIGSVKILFISRGVAFVKSLISSTESGLSFKEFLRAWFLNVFCCFFLFRLTIFNEIEMSYPIYNMSFWPLKG